MRWAVVLLAVGCSQGSDKETTDTSPSTTTQTSPGTPTGTTPSGTATGTATGSTSWPSEPANCGTWAEGTQDDDDGATRDYYNRAAQLPWVNELGDWSDAAGVAQGTTPHATAAVPDDNTPAWVEWDVTALVQDWADGTHPNKGFLLNSPPGPYVFASKEAPNSAEHPELVVTTASGVNTLAPAADTYVDSSTYQGFGDSEILRVGSGQNTLVRFDLTGLTGVSNATLRLWKQEDYGGQTQEVAVFRSSHGLDRPPTPPALGLAASHPGDVGIETHGSVLLFSDFSTATWGDAWSFGTDDTHLERIDAAEANGFEELDGSALRVQVTAGDNYGGAFGYRYLDETGVEPDEAYFRYYLRFGDDWLPTDGGKLPGPSGTYGVAGWGGRPVDGTDGWSARGTYRTVVPAGNPLENHSGIGNYVYHADMAGQYGDIDIWTDGCAGILDKNRWYSVETYVQLNTPGQNDGVLRGWVDGRLAYERTDWRWRDVDTLGVEQIWMNVYHGGTATPPTDLHLYIDNVVIATEYIGPRVP